MPCNDLIVGSQLAAKANDREPSASLPDAGSEVLRSVASEILQAETPRR